MQVCSRGFQRPDLCAVILVLLVVALPCIPMLASGHRVTLKDDGDFFQYCSRHEFVRKSILEYHTFPQRSHFFGGGYPTLGDPEDPSLNPLLLITLIFGTVIGLKIIVFLATLIGAGGMYLMTRRVCNYNIPGAVFSSLVFGMCLWLPLRQESGNPNEVYYYFVPMCILFIALARRRKRYLLILPPVFYTMLSDGKLTFFVSILYIGILCFWDLFPPFSVFPKGSMQKRRFEFSPMKILALALSLTFLLGCIRILPALELIGTKGGLGRMDLAFHSNVYNPIRVHAYTFSQLWREITIWGGATGYLSVGAIPVILCLAASIVDWKRSLPWTISLLLFVWMILAYNAPVDLFALLWNLPIFNAMEYIHKYLSFPIVLTIAILSGRFFLVLARLRPKWLYYCASAILIMLAFLSLYPRNVKVQRNIYESPPVTLTPEKEFFQIQGLNMRRGRLKPLQANTYINLLRNVGTIDWYTGIPIEENAIPKYFVGDRKYSSDGIALFSIYKDKDNRWYMDVAGNQIRIFGRIGGKDIPEIRTTEEVINLSVWQHVAVVEDVPNDTFKVFVNGERKEIKKTLSGPIDFTDMPNDSESVIGARYDHTGSLIHFFGVIDEAAIYNRALTQDEIRGDMEGLESAVSREGKTDESLVLYLPFEEGTGETTEDASGHGNIGTLKGGVQWTNDGRIGNALSFDGANDYVSLGPRLNDLRKPKTYEFWIKPSRFASELYRENPDYRGEFHFLEPGNSASGYFRPNSIVANVNVKTPGVLVINQNYHRDWRADRGSIANRNGLLALHLNETGDYSVSLRYTSRSFCRGLVISFISLIAFALISWSYASGRLRRWSQAKSAVLRIPARAIAYLIE